MYCSVIEEILSVLVEKETLDRECEGVFDVAVMVTVKRAIRGKVLNGDLFSLNSTRVVLCEFLLLPGRAFN